MEYDDHLGCRNELVELRAGDIIIVAGNQPHAGCSFMTDNVRIHWYDNDPGISQTQGYLFPGMYGSHRIMMIYLLNYIYYASSHRIIL
jgi:hypothetical protein